MVFLGKLPEEKPATGGKINIGLLRLLDKLANASGLNWLPFANGGDQQWQRQIPGRQLRNQFAESRILDIRRERRKTGELFIHLYYPDSEETIGCEIFRNTLKLPSCPDAIRSIANQDVWLLQGIGAGTVSDIILQAKALSNMAVAPNNFAGCYGKTPTPSKKPDDKSPAISGIAYPSTLNQEDASVQGCIPHAGAWEQWRMHFTREQHAAKCRTRVWKLLPGVKQMIVCN